MLIKVLIVEDDLMIADLTEEVLEGAGYAVCGIARTVAQGVALYRLHTPSLAVIDMRLAEGGLGTDIIEQLGNPVGFGVLYATGNVSQVMAVSIAGCACLTKPFSAFDLLRSLELVREIATTGSASPPFPRGFRQSYLAIDGALHAARS